MRTCLQPIAYLLGVTAMITTDASYANGRTTPRTTQMVVTVASCVEQKGAPGREVFRARLTGLVGPSDSLRVRVGGEAEYIAIGRISAIEFGEGAVDESGFKPATIVRDGNEEKGAVRVASPTGTHALQLAGFTRTGENIVVDVRRCKTIYFSPAGRGTVPAEEEPGAKH